MTDASLPVRDPPAFPDGATESVVCGALLAGGTSSRFGDRNKLLADVDGEPMVRRAAETLLAAELDGVVAVVGYEADRVRAALDGLDVAVRVNDAYGAGQSTSVRTALDAARECDADAILVALGDMPFVSTEAVTALRATYETGSYTALAAACDGERGNPVLFGSTHFDALASVTGDEGGRQILLEADDAALVETVDPGVRRDVDEPADWPGSDDL